MKITIESTPVIVEVDDGMAARRWEGTTDGGVPIVALVARVSPQTNDPEVLARFTAELEERAPPPVPTYEGRVAALSFAIMLALGSEMKRPAHRDNVFVVLNALASAVAVVLAGCDDQSAGEFFTRALNDNLADARDLPQGNGDATTH